MGAYLSNLRFSTYPYECSLNGNRDSDLERVRTAG